MSWQDRAKFLGASTTVKSSAMVNPNKLAGGGEAIIRAGVPPYGSLETLALTRAALAAEERQQVSTAAMRISWAGEEFGRQLANVIAEFANTPYKWVNIQTKPQHPIWNEARCVHIHCIIQHTCIMAHYTRV